LITQHYTRRSQHGMCARTKSRTHTHTHVCGLRDSGPVNVLALRRLLAWRCTRTRTHVGRDLVVRIFAVHHTCTGRLLTCLHAHTVLLGIGDVGAGCLILRDTWTLYLHLTYTHYAHPRWTGFRSGMGSSPEDGAPCALPAPTAVASVTVVGRASLRVHDSAGARMSAPTMMQELSVIEITDPQRAWKDAVAAPYPTPHTLVGTLGGRWDALRINAFCC
jgi:hypothetical protein